MTWTLGTVKLILILTVILAGLFACAAVLGDEKSVSAGTAVKRVLGYTHNRRPHRLDEPLRVENISDEEVREIQLVIAGVFPGAIANISGVTAKCPCEEGLFCDSQVWILAYRNSRYDGLMLSRIEDKWTVGPIQEWWFRYDKLRIRMREVLSRRAPDYYDRYRKLLDEMLRLQQEYPACTL